MDSPIKLIEWLVGAIGALMAALYTHQAKQISEVKSSVSTLKTKQENDLIMTMQQLERGRQDLAELLHQHAKESSDRHIKLMSTLHEWIEKKEDKKGPV